MWYNFTVLMHLEYASETAICYSKTYTRILVQDYNESLTAGYVAKARLLVLLSPASDFHGLVPPRNFFNIFLVCLHAFR